MELSEFKSQYFYWRKKLQNTIHKCLEINEIEKKITNTWNLKDIIAHINWYDKEMIELLKTRKFKDSNYWNTPLDERNEKIRNKAMELSNNEVLKQFQKNSKKLESLIKKLKQDELQNAKYYEGMPYEWSPSKVLVGNLQDHYKDHFKILDRKCRN